MADPHDDLTGWLRRVRPATPADDAWTSTADADQVLAHIHERIDANMATDRAARRAARPRPVRVLRTWAPGAVLAGAAAVAVALAGAGSPGADDSTPGTPPGAAGPGTGAPTQPARQAARPHDLLLANFDSCDSLLAGLRKQTLAHATSLNWQTDPRFAVLTPAVADGAVLQTSAVGANAAGAEKAASTPGAGSGTSMTNDQEAGVDEPDLVKTDDGRVVSITGGVLHVIDAASRSLTGTLDLSMYQGAGGAQLFVHGDHALVILAGTPEYAYQAMPAGDVLRPSNSLPPVPRQTHRSTYLFVDLSGTPRVTGSLRADGSYLDARLVGSTVRLVVRSTPSISPPASTSGSYRKQLAALHRAIAAAPLSAWLPGYTLTSGYRADTGTVGCGAVSHPARYTGTSLLTIYTLDLDHPDTGPAPVSVAADGETVYATAASLYVATNPDWQLGAARAAQSTEIHRFDITGTGRPVYLGSGRVPGRLLSQYSLSDYQGHLRVATTVGGTTANAVYVLRADTLALTGHVDRLGNDERIYSVRFEGPIGYVVTFRETDPLYVLDLHDPARPVVAGHLDLTGYSDYLHDAGDGRLLGVGQQTDRHGVVSGLQVSLFDVSHPARPTRTGHVVLAHTADETRLDPHAFLYWLPTGLTVVPVPSGRGTVLVLRVDGHTLRRVGTVANEGPADVRSAIQRSVLVDGALWTVSASGVRVSNADTLARQAWIAF